MLYITRVNRRKLIVKYLGSKRRIAKELLEIILPYRKDGQAWVEPFVGGANMIDKVEGRRIGADINHYVIACYKAIQDGWIPPEKLSEQEYKEIKASKDAYPDHMVWFALALCSFAGSWCLARLSQVARVS